MTDKKYQIFISSTFSDLQDERKLILEAILITNNIPIGMESFVATSQEQFEHIKDCINNCDYYILIVGGRYGSLHPELNISYTELEFDYAKSLNKPILAFIYRDIDKCRQKDSDSENINNFRNKVQKEHLCQLFDDKTELKGLALTALTQEIMRNPQVGWVRSDKISTMFKAQKDCIQDLIQTGESLYPSAINHLHRFRQLGFYVEPFSEDCTFRIWIQKIVEFFKLNNISNSYLYIFDGSTPYAIVIKEQLILLRGLLANYEYKEILN